MALKKNLDVTIHEAFLEEILRGNWLPGQALNLDELAERYGVSRTPVQQESASGDHEMVLDALRAGDFSQAHSIIEEHIQGACQKILIKMHA